MQDLSRACGPLRLRGMLVEGWVGLGHWKLPVWGGGPHLVAVHLRRRDVVLHGGRDGSPDGVHQSHHVVAQLALSARRRSSLRNTTALQMEHHPQLCRVAHVLQRLPLRIQLPAGAKTTSLEPSWYVGTLSG